MKVLLEPLTFITTPLNSQLTAITMPPSLRSVTNKDCSDTDIKAIKFNSLFSKGKNVQKTQLSLYSAGILRDKFVLSEFQEQTHTHTQNTKLKLRAGKFCRGSSFPFWHHTEVFRTRSLFFGDVKPSPLPSLYISTQCGGTIFLLMIASY